MIEVSWATPLYEFLRQCNASPLQKTVLDCGAGGSDPAIALFHRHGYRTCGIEIANEALSKATEYARRNRMQMNIMRGDMRAIPFASETFSFVYAFNSIFFMTKPDVGRAMKEIERVLVPGGLCFVNFVLVDDPGDRRFSENAPARRLLGSDRFSKHADDEADAYFGNFDVLRKERRVVDKVHGKGRLVQAYVDYIARKACAAQDAPTASWAGPGSPPGCTPVTAPSAPHALADELRKQFACTAPGHKAPQLTDAAR